MNEKEKGEYQTVALAALLHDIGKFLNRADVQKKHPNDGYFKAMPLS